MPSGGTAYVVAKKVDSGLKRIHGPFSSEMEARAAGGEVKFVNLVSKGMGGSHMVIEKHSDGEVFHGFFDNQGAATRWINRQPDQETLIDTFVVKVHPHGSLARGSRAKEREGYQSPFGHTHVVVNSTDEGPEFFGPFTDKSEAKRVSDIFSDDEEVHSSTVSVANIVSAKKGGWAVIAQHDDGTERSDVIYGFFKSESAAEDWMNRQPDEQTMMEMFVSKVHKPRV